MGSPGLLALQAGADGFEVQSELLLAGEAELAELRQALSDAVRICSSHEGLWDADGRLNQTALARGLAHARALGSSRLKMAIGGYEASTRPSLKELHAALTGSGIALVIENDQTTKAGTVTALQAFFEAADLAGVKLGMTFDIGNWHWTGECPLQAAAVLAPRVCYVHCKGVQRLGHRWVAVPLAELAAPWRAVLRAQPIDQPWAIEYPLAGDDLLAVTRQELAQLREVARSFE